MRAVAGTLNSAAPIDALAVGLDAVSEMLTDQRDCVRTRQAVIMANPELQERDLIKLTSMSAALADTLRRHGVTEPAASLAAKAGVAVFKVGFERWIAGDEELELSRLMRESLDEPKAVTAGRSVCCPEGLLTWGTGDRPASTAAGASQLPRVVRFAGVRPGWARPRARLPEVERSPAAAIFGHASVAFA